MVFSACVAITGIAAAYIFYIKRPDLPEKFTKGQWGFELVQNKYGVDKVAQIITFGTLQPRAALRDVGRVLNMPYPQVDRICKLVPNNPANPISLKEAIDHEPLLRQEIESNPGVARLIEISIKFSLNILIKLMSVVSLVIAPFLF